MARRRWIRSEPRQTGKTDGLTSDQREPAESREGKPRAQLGNIQSMRGNARATSKLQGFLEAGSSSETGTRGGELYLYHRSGDDVVLPCNSPSSNYSCFIVNWIYLRDPSSAYLLEVRDGKVVQSSPGAARLNVDSKCSLIINNITAEDAGWYTCRPGSRATLDGRVLLCVLTVSPSPPGADPTKDGDFTLQCSLERYSELGPCPEKSLFWVDETGSELLGEGVGFKSGGQTGCDSNLTVKLQSSSNRRYTCQFVEDNIMKVEAHYEIEASTDWSPLSFIMMTLRITALILMVGITVGIIRTRGSKTPQKDINVHDAVDDDPVDYENDEERSAATLS